MMLSEQKFAESARAGLYAVQISRHGGKYRLGAQVSLAEPLAPVVRTNGRVIEWPSLSRVELYLEGHGIMNKPVQLVL